MPLRRTVADALRALTFATWAALLVAAAQAQPAPSATVDAGQVGKEQRSRLGLYLLPKQATQFVGKHQDKLPFVDVRTRAEAVFVGMATPAGALVSYVECPEFNAAWRWDDERNAYGYEPLNGFGPEIARRLKQKRLTKHDPVVLICRSGERSARAADLLAQLGHTQVDSLVEGFEGPLNMISGERDSGGWKNAGAPWRYALDKNKMYFAH